MDNIIIRLGTPREIPGAMALIRELAEYENGLHKVKLTEEQMLADGFGANPLFQFLVAMDQQKVVGLSLFYPRYSTWKGKGMYLEDLVVTKAYRNRGIGEQLLLDTAKMARELHCTGLYWQVLNWNTPAIHFYERWGAQFDDEWINCKLNEAGLRAV